MVNEQQRFGDVIGDGAGGYAQLSGYFRITQTIETMQQEGFPGTGIGGRQTSLDALDQLLRLCVLFGRTRCVRTVCLLKGLIGENALRHCGATEVIDAHLFDHVREESDRISDGRVLLVLIAIEAKAALLNQLINVVSARIAPLEQASSQKSQLFLQTVAQGFFVLSVIRRPSRSQRRSPAGHRSRG